MSAEIVVLPNSTEDIARMMEALAAQVRSGEIDAKSGACILLCQSGEPVVAGWGRDATDVNSMGLFTLGAAWLAAHAVKR